MGWREEMEMEMVMVMEKEKEEKWLHGKDRREQERQSQLFEQKK